MKSNREGREEEEGGGTAISSGRKGGEGGEGEESVYTYVVEWLFFYCRQSGYGI